MTSLERLTIDQRIDATIELIVSMKLTHTEKRAIIDRHIGIDATASMIIVTAISMLFARERAMS
jgi:hypothetical protein